jgi:hypothetical protein
MRLASLLIAAVALGLSGCATVYENHIESKLVDAGLSRPDAACIAERMVDRLSRRQLDSIGRVAGGGKTGPGEMSLDQFLHRYRAALDPEVYSVLLGAGARCLLAG